MRRPRERQAAHNGAPIGALALGGGLPAGGANGRPDGAHDPGDRVVRVALDADQQRFGVAERAYGADAQRNGDVRPFDAAGHWDGAGLPGLVGLGLPVEVFARAEPAAANVPRPFFAANLDVDPNPLAGWPPWPVPAAAAAFEGAAAPDAQPVLHAGPQDFARMDLYGEAPGRAAGRPPGWPREHVPRGAPLPSPYGRPASDAAYFRRVASPFREIFALNLILPVNQHASIERQLLFFAAMLGPVQPFSIVCGEDPTGWQTHFPEQQEGDLKSFVRDTLEANNPGLFTLHLHAPPTYVVIHGDHNPNIGRALYGISDEFQAALQLTYDRGLALGHHRLLQDLLHSIGNWCFDGSVNVLNRWLQEQALSGEDLSLVANLDGKNSDEKRAAEFVRVYRLYQARRFTEHTGLAAENTRGELEPHFAAAYFNPPQFLAFLENGESASALSQAERCAYVKAAVAMDLF